jgi:HD-GYP domain-containing protein (c-di-GMP phosphodiesterase class II)
MSTLAGSNPVAVEDRAARAVEGTREARSRRLGQRGRFSVILLGGAFLAVAIPLAFLPSDRQPSLALVALLVGAYALASRVEFEIGPGSAVPTQLVLVPMLFLLPLGLVPLCVAAGFFLSSGFEHLRGHVPLERSILHLVTAWHSVGPVLVLYLVGERLPEWEWAPVLALALGAQFAFDFAATGVVAKTFNGTSPREHLRTMSWVYLVDTGLAPIGLAVALVAVDAPFAFALTLPLIALLSVFARERRVRFDHAVELSHAYRGTALLLGDVVEADDAYTGSHSRGVVELVLGVCDELGVDERQRRDAEFTALLHDVGKIAIPSTVINKPGPLTPEERALIETHTIEGERMLERVGGLLGEIGRLIRSCHERYDGTGYPDRLAGEEIPLIARIVCACDAYDAMTTDRPYRAARPVHEALAELCACAGTQFDPVVVDAVVAVVARAD